MANEKLAAYLEGNREQRANSLRMYCGRPMDECMAHLALLDDVRIEIGYELRAEQVPFGATREQAVAIAQAKAKNYRKHAGLRALKAKLGREGAEEYISRKAGRHISIR